MKLYKFWTYSNNDDDNVVNNPYSTLLNTETIKLRLVECSEDLCWIFFGLSDSVDLISCDLLYSDTTYDIIIFIYSAIVHCSSSKSLTEIVSTGLQNVLRIFVESFSDSNCSLDLVNKSLCHFQSTLFPVIWLYSHTTSNIIIFLYSILFILLVVIVSEMIFAPNRIEIESLFFV